MEKYRTAIIFLVVLFICTGIACADEFSVKSHFYRVDYLKPVEGSLAIIHAIFAHRPNPDQAESFLREEIERSLKYTNHKGDIMAYAWVGDDAMPLKDGSEFVIRVAKTGKVICAKEYWTSKMPTSDPSKSKEVSIDIKLERNSFGKMRVLGRTNLPNQMYLMVGIRNQLTGYFAQDKVSIANGVFTTDWFSDRGRRLPKGTYEVTISSPLPELQPDSVQKVIGNKGENLSGKMVRMDLGSKMIDLKVTRLVK